MFVLCKARSRSNARYLRFSCATVASLLSVALACAQTSPTDISANQSLSLSDAFRIALVAQPWHAAQDERAREQDSRARVADSWLADQPTIASGLRAGNRDGFREYEIEISAPIATGTRRSLQVNTALGEAALYRATLAQQRLKLAGEVREAYWAVQYAVTELILAKAEASRAAQLAADSARRTAAGDSARVDTLQTQAALQTATSNAIDTEAKLEASKQALRALVGDAAMRALSDAAESHPAFDSKRIDLHEHPSALLARATVASARAKLNEVSNAANAATSVSFTLANERTRSSATSSTARIGVSIPFGGAPRAAPRIAQANADLIEAQTDEPLVQQQLRAETESAHRLLISIEKRIDALVERVRLATEVTDLYAKAYRFGELDLPTRLRAESERANAALALARARIEQKHAISRVNQSLGILP